MLELMKSNVLALEATIAKPLIITFPFQCHIYFEMSKLRIWAICYSELKKTQSWLIKSAVKNLPLAYIPKCQSKIKISKPKKTESPKQQIKQNKSSEILCTVFFFIFIHSSVASVGKKPSFDARHTVTSVGACGSTGRDGTGVLLQIKFYITPLSFVEVVFLRSGSHITHLCSVTSHTL